MRQRNSVTTFSPNTERPGEGTSEPDRVLASLGTEVYGEQPDRLVAIVSSVVAGTDRFEHGLSGLVRLGDISRVRVVRDRQFPADDVGDQGDFVKMPTSLSTRRNLDDGGGDLGRTGVGVGDGLIQNRSSGRIGQQLAGDRRSGRVVVVLLGGTSRQQPENAQCH